MQSYKKSIFRKKFCKYDFKEMMKLQKELRKTLDPSYMKTVTMSELYDTAYLNKPAIINGLLYPGTYLFVGAPKVGKSFLMAQLAYHVSTGKELWENEIRQGKVLYLALEDDYSRLQKRLYRMFGTDGTDNLYFSVSARNLNGGLFEQLEKFISENPDTRLIIIDTLQKVRESATEKYSYASDYEVIAYLYRIKIGDKYLLVKNERGTGKFQPVGGVYKLLDNEKIELKNRFQVKDDNKISIDKSSRNDYRLRIENKYLRKFVRCFNTSSEREQICDLGREFREELIEKGIVDWKQISYRVCGRHMTEINFSKHFQCYENIKKIFGII